jgi:hypothetical protein
MSDVAEVIAILHRRIGRHISRSGPLRRNADELEREPGEPLLAEIYAASVAETLGLEGEELHRAGGVR